MPDDRDIQRHRDYPSGNRGFNPAQLGGSLAGLLAVALAWFFIFGVAYCMVFLDTVSPRLHSHVTFTDIVNLSVWVTPLVLLISILVLSFTVSIVGLRYSRIKRIPHHGWK